MNRLTKIRQQNELNLRELEHNYSGDVAKSWHNKYSKSAWIYVGSLSFDLNEGDIIVAFSQYGELVNINLIRDRETGKSRGFCYLCYADQRSTVLAVDNLNGIKLCGRIIQVDHVEEYKVPKYKESVDESVRKLWAEGCAPKPIEIDEEDAEEEARRLEKERLRASKLSEKKVVKVDDELDKEFRKARKERKKREKDEKKREKWAKKLQKRLRESTPDEERGRADAEGRWDNKKKKLDEKIDDVDFYGQTEHFNFNKKRKEVPTGPTHNIRPDFDKADWRDIEMFKTVREIDRQQHGEKQHKWKDEEHYKPKRIH